jgi:dTDP-D-glucose 4,6-dehydratase
MRNKRIRLHDEGLPVRNWLHAYDTAAAVTTIVESGITDQIFNVAGGFEQKNIDTVKKIIKSYYNDTVDWSNFVDLSYRRQGQDVRYALNDDKLKSLGWKPEKIFDREIDKIVSYYTKNFKW